MLVLWCPGVGQPAPIFRDPTTRVWSGTRQGTGHFRMNTEYGTWREYQEAVAGVFRKLGCSAEVGKKVTGARGSHDLDVFVTFEKFGQECRWIIECKLWSTPVDKSEVHTLLSIVQNLGADRGLIFSESGFQSGARTASQNTNVELHDSLRDFSRTAHLHLSRIPLLSEESDEPDAPHIHVFPGSYQPSHLLKHDGRLFVSNWGTPQVGNIAIFNPEAEAIEGIIELDRYEQVRPTDGQRIVRQHPPGNIACTGHKLFVGQAFSDFVLVIDIETQSIIKRIPIPGGGEGAIAGSPDGRQVYFASNKVPSLFVIDSATYEYSTVDYPEGCRGSLCILPHPYKPLLYIGIQRCSTTGDITHSGGSSLLAVYDLAERRYVGNLCLAQVESGRSDDSSPVCLTYDEQQSCLFVGMFQSQRGICRVDEFGQEILDNFRFSPNSHNKHFSWVDPLSQALYHDKLLSVNRNNRELVTLDRLTGRVEHSLYLGEAPNGPHSVAVFGDTAIISYPERGGLIFHNLAPDP